MADARLRLSCFERMKEGAENTQIEEIQGCCLRAGNNGADIKDLASLLPPGERRHAAIARTSPKPATSHSHASGMTDCPVVTPWTLKNISP